MASGIRVIHCTSTGCDEYGGFQDWIHQDAAGVIGETIDSDTVVIIEHQKRLMYFRRGMNANEMTETPLPEDGWESIYIGEMQPILLQIEELKGLVCNGPYCMVFLNDSEQGARFCFPLPRVQTPLEYSLLETLSTEVFKFQQEVDIVRLTIDQQIDQVIDNVTHHLASTIPELDCEKREYISEIVAHRSVAFGSFLPFLLMEETEEVFLDRPGTSLYFDHQRFGRCQTSVVIDREYVSRIVTLIRSEVNLHLDRRNPSLKADLTIQQMPLRISASIEPLSPEGLHLEIRRARRRAFSLRDLIANGTLTVEAASVLLLAVVSRFNITITGGPGAGKTTLLNALDMVTPRDWRKVYIEDASESRTIEGHHQVRFSVDPVDERVRSFTKEEEIVKSLHRSPDYLILGEIQTREHSEALFQAVVAGLKVMQTCHGDSALGLVSRWNDAHRIAKSSIGLMDLIVTIERFQPGRSRRRVTEISEICRDSRDGFVHFIGLNQVYTHRDGMVGRWSPNGPFMRTAKSLGLSSHEPALKTLMDLIRSGLDLESNLSNRPFLYNAHPMENLTQI
ncbi:MAG: ATPase, T2SS/T4P/T4SS family [Candidatus Thorarchaeota archaeon]|nr:MAG: hypothetical protein DRP09_07840 [Candidatus Thorarchaeota archaeon]